MFIGSSYTRSKLAFAFVTMMLIMTQSLFAQESGSLKGRVLDKESGEALIGANIVVLNTSLGAATDIEGRFLVHVIPVGKRSVKISYIGYKTITVDVTIADNTTLEQDFRLSAQALTGETVIVTAQARGQMASINQQLASTSIINVVSAEKMKELPDANIAESIGRLPGISLQRNAGEADAVIVRGLSPKYNQITIEGVPMSSTYWGDRGVDLSLLGDNLVKGVEVSKTLRPDMDADALGGTVNLTLRTAQPGFHYDVWGNGGYTKLRSSYKNYKFSGSAGDRFFDDQFGALIQGNIEEKQLPSDQLNASYASPTVNPTTKQLYVNTQSALLRDNSTKRHRYGASLILDYTSDFVDVKLFNVYDQKNDSNITRDNTTNFQSTEFFDQIFVNQTKTEQRTHSIQALFKPGGTELPVSFSYTKGEQHTPNAQEFDFKQTGVQTAPKGNALVYGVPLNLINQMGVLAPTNANSYLTNILASNTDLTDASYDAKIDWKVPFKLSESFSGKLSIGGKYHSVDRTSTNSQLADYLQYGDGATNRVDIVTNPLFQSYFPHLADFSDPVIRGINPGIPAYPFSDPSYTRGDILGYPIGPSWGVYGLVHMQNVFATLPGVAIWKTGAPEYNQNYTDKENSRAGYAMGEFNIGSNLTIVPGARYQEERTDISAYHVRVNTGNATGLDGVAPVLVETKRDNPYWYPSINAKYKASENIQIMAAAYRSVSLPSYSEISPLVVLRDDGNPIVTGNPLLKPSTAVNYDLGTSVFSNDIGLFTVDLFYKEISDLIYSMQNFFPYAPYPVSGAPADIADRLPGRSYYDTTWMLLVPGRRVLSGSIPINDPSKAYLRGIELSWQTHFWYLPGLLNGIVLELNASFMSSNQLYPYFKTHLTRFGSIDTLVYSTTGGALQNQPKAIYNAILGWDYKGFSSRFSLRYQQLTLTSMDTQYGLEDSYYDNVLLFDISLKQQIIENLSVFANATNVNGHVDNYYFNHPAYLALPSANLPTSGQTYGLNAQFGISFSY